MIQTPGDANRAGVIFGIRKPKTTGRVGRKNRLLSRGGASPVTEARSYGGGPLGDTHPQRLSLVFREIAHETYLLVGRRNHEAEAFEACPAGLEATQRTRAELLNLKACGHSVIIESPGEVALPL